MGQMDSVQKLKNLEYANLPVYLFTGFFTGYFRPLQ